MTIDDLIIHLQGLRNTHGGNIPVMIGQSNPDNPNLWSGIDVKPEMIRSSVTAVSDTSVPGHDYKSGWIWFQIPDGGIKHRRVSAE